MFLVQYKGVGYQNWQHADDFIDLNPNGKIKHVTRQISNWVKKLGYTDSDLLKPYPEALLRK